MVLEVFTPDDKKIGIYFKPDNLITINNAEFGPYNIYVFEVHEEESKSLPIKIINPISLEDRVLKS